MFIRPLIATTFSLLLTACALSPQYVEIDPDIEVRQQVVSTHVTTLDIVDRRPKSELGTRGGVYAETSFIYPSQPLPDSLRPAAIEALGKLGLATQGQSPQPVNITLYIDELSYHTDSAALQKNVTLNCRISAEIKKGTRSHQGNFNSTKMHSYLKAPNEGENRKIINEVLSETLTRVFNDTQVINFIQN
ncbi:MAG: YajG family lipoprotein [Motiliproteus sp.]|nr:YajG family lipoprotein [Motiliproteus sp.]MCW9053012.1 YajG family lipoprotein [Motiliproteus sp.]